jgi:two-component system, chemotaxis family, chemotaxis protein CheY
MDCERLRECSRGSTASASMGTIPSEISKQLESLKVLIVDDEFGMRKVTRALLQAIGVRTIYEAFDGRSGLDAIRAHEPDVVILDWEMPSPNGPEFVRLVRSPESFPLPDIPIIMLTGHGERSRVVEAMRLGVNEFLLKPVSSGALLARFVSVLAKPRRMVRDGDYYGPEPRHPASDKPEADLALGEVVFI